MDTKKIEVKKATRLILIVSIVQVGALALLLLYSFFYRERFYAAFGSSGQYFLVIVTIASVINSILSIRETYLWVKTDSQHQLLKNSLAQVENLNHTLRAQRHDFLNHLQVVYGLMEMDEYKDAQDYIEKVYKDIQKVSRVLKTSNPAINALLQAKMLDAEKRDIVMDLHVTSRFENLPIPSWEFCKVLGNLIDNAIAALEEKTCDRRLKVELGEDLKSFLFRVEDNGPGIPKKHMDKIFQRGFTTKGDRGEGMGLAITKETLERYGGSIEVESREGFTLFAGRILKPS